MRIGVDVDLCVVGSDYGWINYLLYRYGPMSTPFETEGKLNYNLGVYWDNITGDSHMDYWRSEFLYEDMEPYPEAKTVLSRLHKEGHEIVFISHIKGATHKSKYYFLKKHFPFMAGFCATQEKYLVDVDVMIDDRDNNLVNFKEGVKLIRYETIYQQSIPLNDRVIICEGWGSIEEEIRSGRECS